MTEVHGQLPTDAPVWHHPGRLVQVVDGDTVDLEYDLGFNCRKTDRLRLYGVDTAEIYGTARDSDEYRQAVGHTRFVRSWLNDASAAYPTAPDEDGWPFSIYTLKQRGKFRWLGDVCRRTDGQSIVFALFEEFGQSIGYDR
jgi:micrococcal nuclease